MRIALLARSICSSGPDYRSGEVGNKTSTILCPCMGRVPAPFGRELGARGSSASTKVLLALRSSGGSTLVQGLQGAQLAPAGSPPPRIAVSRIRAFLQGGQEMGLWPRCQQNA